MRVKLKGKVEMSVNGVELPARTLNVDVATMDGKLFTVGTSVRWQYQKSGRADLEWDVTATVVRLGKKRILVRAQLADGNPVERWANPQHLTPQ